MRQIQIAIAVLILFASDHLLGEVAGSLERRYVLPDHGNFVVQVPRSWNDRLHQPPNRLPPTIVFRQSSGQPFEFLLTTLWPATKDRPPASRESLRRQVEQSARMAKSQAMESELRVIEFQARSGEGFYFSATDRAPKPGEYKFITQGILHVGDRCATIFSP